MEGVAAEATQAKFLAGLEVEWGEAGVAVGELHIEQAEAKKVFEKHGISTATMADRVRHCVQSTFAGKRIVIFSGGEAKDTPAVLDEVKGLAKGGAFGSIMGRNAFQRPHDEAVALLHKVMAIYAAA